MIRTLDAAFLNGVANHPEVRPWLGGEGALDLSGIVADPINVALVFEHGGFVVHKHDVGIYECHSLFLPQGRGKDIIKHVREAMRYMFTMTDCIEVQTRVPLNNMAAMALTQRTGFRKLFERKSAWPHDGKMVDCAYWTYTVDDWMRDDATLESIGQDFHDKLGAAKISFGVSEPIHDEDEAHNRAVGAAVSMIRSGNAPKGVWTYNRWARLAGYQPVALVSQNPVIIDQVDAVIQVTPDGMEVLQCR